MTDAKWNEEQWREHYEEVFAGGDRTLDFPSARHQAECFATCLKWSAPEPGSTALDFGCGWGQFSHMLASLGVHVTGAEYLESQVERLNKEAAKNPLLDFVEADLTKPDEWPFNDRYFDAVYAIEVLHLGYPVPQLLRLMWERVAPGGRLVGVVGNENSQIVRTMARNLGIQHVGISRYGMADLLRSLPGVADTRYAGLHHDASQKIEVFDSRRVHDNDDVQEPYRWAFVAVRS